MKDFKKLIDEAVLARTSLYQQIAPLNQKINILNIQIADLKEEQALAIDYTTMSREEQLKYFLFEDGQVAGSRYTDRRGFWARSELSTNGYIPEINQVQLRVVMYRDDPESLTNTLAAMDEVLPFVEYLNGLKVISIFEHNLSESGRYELVYDGTDYLVRRTYYGRTDIVMKSERLVDVLTYIQANLYYEVSR